MVHIAKGWAGGLPGDNLGQPVAIPVGPSEGRLEIRTSQLDYANDSALNALQARDCDLGLVAERNQLQRLCVSVTIDVDLSALENGGRFIEHEFFVARHGRRHCYLDLNVGNHLVQCCQRLGVALIRSELGGSCDWL